MTRVLTIGLTLLLCASCATNNEDSQRKALLHLQAGTHFLSTGNYPGAMNELLQAQELEPRNPTIQNNLGLAFYVRGKFNEAEEHFRKAVSYQQKYTEARNNLGRTLIELGKLNEAIKELTIATNDLTYPTPEKSYSNLGLAYFRKRDYVTASTNFAKSLQMQANSCNTMNYYGQTLFEQKKYVPAAESFDRAITICKKDNFDEPYYFAGLSYMKAGQREQSVARLEQLLQQFPKTAYQAKAQTLLDILR